VNVGSAQTVNETTDTYPLTFFDEGKPEDKTGVTRGPNWGERQSEPSATMNARHLYCYFTAGGLSGGQVAQIQDGYVQSFADYQDPRPECQ